MLYRVRVVISITAIYVGEVIAASTAISDSCHGSFFGERKEQAIHGWVFGRDRYAGACLQIYRRT